MYLQKKWVSDEAILNLVLADSKKGLYIKAKDGIINVLEIQGENAKRMSISDFLRGNQINIGEIFE